VDGDRREFLNDPAIVLRELLANAFDAKKASLVGDDADLILTRLEATERARRAGL
jgi:hypothetical protein